MCDANWAYDAFTRTAKVVLRCTAPLSGCEFSSGTCHAYTASLSDRATSLPPCPAPI